MKSLQEHLNESIMEAMVDSYHLETNEFGDFFLRICDDGGNILDFDEKWIETLLNRYNGWNNVKFAQAVFRKMRDADQLLVEISRDGAENEQYEYILRDEIKWGWGAA